MLASLVVGAHRHARRAGLPLEEAGAAIDAAVAAQFGRSTFVTGRLGRLDLATGVLRWVNAGHPPPLWWHEGALVPWPDHRPDVPFGLGHRSTVHELQLSPGDRVLLHTDGVVEARPRRGAAYGQDKLVARFVEGARAGADVLASLRGMVAALLEHQAGQPLRDDATLLEVLWRGPSGRR
jgi:serine phosphatase RsbU (regulator of sigma subunit)